MQRLAEENASLNSTLQRLVEDKLVLNAQYEDSLRIRHQLTQQLELKDEEIVQIKKKLGFDRAKADEANYVRHTALEEVEQLRREMDEIRIQNEEFSQRVKKEEQSRAQAWEAVVIRDKQLQTLQKEHFALLNKLGQRANGEPLIVDVEGLHHDEAQSVAHMLEEINRDQVEVLREANLARLSKEKKLFLENVKLAEENEVLKHRIDVLERNDARMQASTAEANQKMISIENTYKHTIVVLESEQRRRMDLSEQNEDLRLKIEQHQKEAECLREQLAEATKTKMMTKMVAAESINEFSMRMKSALERITQQEAAAQQFHKVISDLEAALEESRANEKVANSAKDEALLRKENAESELAAVERKLKAFQKSVSAFEEERRAADKEKQGLIDEIEKTRSILRNEVEKNVELTSQSQEVHQLRIKNQQIVQIWRSEEAQVLRGKQEGQVAAEMIKDLEMKNAQLRRVTSQQQTSLSECSFRSRGKRSART